MSGSITLGENYELIEQTNGDFELVDTNNSVTVLTHDNLNNELTINPVALFGDIQDASSGNLVYDTSTETLGDSNQDADLSNVTLADIIDTDTSNTVYDSNTETLGDGNQSGDLANVTLQDIIDTSTSNTVYDSSAEQLGDGNQDASFDVTDTNTVENQDYNEAVDTGFSTASGTLDIDLSVANWYEIQADGDITISFSNVTSTPPGNSLILYFEDTDGTGPHTITWPSSVIWTDGNVRNTIDSNSDLEIALRTPDGGTEWRASRSGKDFS